LKTWQQGPPTGRSCPARSRNAGRCEGRGFDSHRRHVFCRLSCRLQGIPLAVAVVWGLVMFQGGLSARVLLCNGLGMCTAAVEVLLSQQVFLNRRCYRAYRQLRTLSRKEMAGIYSYIVLYRSYIVLYRTAMNKLLQRSNRLLQAVA